MTLVQFIRSKGKIAILGLLVAIVGLLPILPVDAQDATYVAIRSIEGFPVVSARVSVADVKGRALRSLHQSDFMVEEDEEIISEFTVEEIERREPISVALAIDTSGSMYGQSIADAKDAAQNFVIALEPRDEVALFTFDESVNMEADFSNDHGSLLQAIVGMETLPRGTGSTLLYQVIFDAVQKASEGPLGQRLVLLLTDGEDVDSPVTLDDVISVAQLHSVPVFVVAIDRGNPGFISKMERLALMTGGILYVVEGGQTGGLATEFAAIIDLLKWQYQVSYYSALPADGEAHTLRLRVCRGGCSEPSEMEFLAVRTTAPPTPVPVPTATPPPAAEEMQIDVVVYVDEDENGVWVPEEGIEGIVVRVIDPNTNKILAHLRTNAQGHALFQVAMERNSRLSVHYIGGFYVDIIKNLPPIGPIVLRVQPVAVPGTIP